MNIPTETTSDEALRLQLVAVLRQAVDEQDRDLVDFASITEATELAQLPLDSLATIELIFSIEETFGITVPEAAAYGFSTVGDVLGYIRQHAAP